MIIAILIAIVAKKLNGILKKNNLILNLLKIISLTSAKPSAYKEKEAYASNNVQKKEQP